METTKKTCIACEGSGSEPCKAHIYEPEFLTTSDARFDFADVYYWPCCQEITLTETSEYGFDIFPKRTGGCQESNAHLFKANAVLVYFDNNGKEVAEKVKDQSNAFKIDFQIRNVDDASLPVDSPCVYVVFLPAVKEKRYSLPELEAISKNHAMLYFGGNNESEDLRYHVGSLEPMTICNDLILALARQHYGIDDSKFPVFISYARRFEKDTKALMDSIPEFDRWKDSVFLSPGVVWSNEIELAIKNSYLFICFLHTGITAQSYIWEEVRLARLYDKPIIFAANDFDWHFLLNNPELKTGEMIPGLQFLSRSFLSDEPNMNKNFFYYDIALIQPFLMDAKNNGFVDSAIDPNEHFHAHIEDCLNTIYKTKAINGDAYAGQKSRRNKDSRMHFLRSEQVTAIEKFMTSTGFFERHSI